MASWTWNLASTSTLFKLKRTLIKGRKKWRPRRLSPNHQERRESKEERKVGGIGGWREGTGRRELTA